MIDLSVFPGLNSVTGISPKLTFMNTVFSCQLVYCFCLSTCSWCHSNLSSSRLQKCFVLWFHFKFEKVLLSSTSPRFIFREVPITKTSSCNQTSWLENGHGTETSEKIVVSHYHKHIWLMLERLVQFSYCCPIEHTRARVYNFFDLPFQFLWSWITLSIRWKPTLRVSFNCVGVQLLQTWFKWLLQEIVWRYVPKLNYVLGRSCISQMCLEDTCSLVQTGERS